MAHGLIKAMEFYGLDPQAWDVVPWADQARMLATVPYLGDADCWVAGGTWQHRLAAVEEHAQREARLAVALMEMMPMSAVWHQLRHEVTQKHVMIRPVAPAASHPQYWALVELLQRCLTTIEVHLELGRTGADGLTALQIEDVRTAAERSARASLAAHVPHCVAEMLLALKPAILLG